jgi:hypothetical protein
MAIKKRERTDLAGDDYPVIQAALANLPPLDLRQISKISGIGIGALNVQFARNIYPWMKSGQQGRARRFDPNFAFHIVLTGVLIKLGLSLHVASARAVHIMMAKDLSEPDLRAVIGQEIGQRFDQQIQVIQAKMLPEFDQALFSGNEIDAFIVVDISRVFRRFLDAATSEKDGPV